MRNCPSCGKAFAESVRELCPECGAPFKDPVFLNKERDLRKTCAEHPEDAEPHAKLADLYLQFNMPKSAEAEYLNVMNLDENYTGLYERLARIYYEDHRDDIALQFLQKALAEKPGDPDLTSLVARIALRLQLWDQALDNASALLAQNGSNIDMLSVRAAALRAKGDSWGLLETLQKLESLGAVVEGLSAEIARLHEALGNRDQAVVSWQHILDRDPDDKDAIRSIGKILFAKEDYEKAIPHLLRSDFAAQAEPAAMLFIAYVKTERLDDADALLRSLYFSPDRHQDRTRKLMGRALFELAGKVKAQGRLNAAVHYLERSNSFQADPAATRELEAIQGEIRRRAEGRKVKWAAVAGAVIAGVVLIGFLASAKLVVPGEKGVRIEVRDGERVLCAAQESDCKTGRLFLGPYRISAKREGYSDFEKTFWAVSGLMRTVRPVFAPKYGSLEIKTKPAGAEVLLDGKPAGATPLVLDKVLARPAALTIRKEGRVTVSENLEPKEGARTLIERSLPRRVYFDFKSPPAGLRLEGMKPADGKLLASETQDGNRAAEAWYEARPFKNFIAAVKVRATRRSGAVPAPSAPQWSFGIKFRESSFSCGADKKSCHWTEGPGRGLLFYSLRDRSGQQGLYLTLNEGGNWDVIRRFGMDLNPDAESKLAVRCVEKACSFSLDGRELGHEGVPVKDTGLIGLFSYPGLFDVSFSDFEIVEIPDEKDPRAWED